MVSWSALNVSRVFLGADMGQFAKTIYIRYLIYITEPWLQLYCYSVFLSEIQLGPVTNQFSYSIKVVNILSMISKKKSLKIEFSFIFAGVERAVKGRITKKKKRRSKSD